MKKVLLLIAAALSLQAQVLVNGSYVFEGGVNTFADTGTANAYVGAPGITAYVTRASYCFLPAHSNTGASTVNLSGLGPVAIEKAGASALAGGELLANQPVCLMYDGAAMQIPGGGGGTAGANYALNNLVAPLLNISLGAGVAGVSLGLGADPLQYLSFYGGGTWGASTEFVLGGTCTAGPCLWSFPQAAADTVVGLNTTQTLNNKTLASAALTGSTTITNAVCSGSCTGFAAGVSAAGQLGDFATSMTSSTVTIGASCASVAACNVRFGYNVLAVSSSATVTIGTTTSGTTYNYITAAGAYVVGYPSSGMVISGCGGCTAISGIVAFPVNTIPISKCTAAANIWSGCTDERAFESAPANYINGGGLIITPAAGSLTLAYDPAVIAPLTSPAFLGTPATALGASFGCTHGSNATCGVSTLASGTVTVSTTAIAALAASGAAGDIVTLTLQTCSSCGSLSIGTVTAATSFVINSTNGSDASKVFWQIGVVN